MTDLIDFIPTIEDIIKNGTIGGDELTEDELVELMDWFQDLDEEEIC